jgi:hypothetical protein
LIFNDLQGCFNAADPQRRRLFLYIALMRALQSIDDAMLHTSDTASAFGEQSVARGKPRPAA